MRKQMTGWFGLKALDESRWDRIRDKLIREIENIKSGRSLS